MAKDPASQSYGVGSARFWRNVTLIALAHVALIAGLIRWSVEARISPNAQSIVWLSGAEDIAARESANEVSPSIKPEPPEPESELSKYDEVEEEKPVATPKVLGVKSEIELPSPTPTPAATPKAFGTTPTPKQKATPKPVPKSTPRKALLAKASLKPSPKTKPSVAKSSEKPEKNEKSPMAKARTASQSGSAKTSSTGKGGSASGASSPGAAGEFGWYGNMLHDRFYSAWIQPTANITTTGTKISTLVKVRIEKDGRVSSFEIIKPSENVVIDESVGAIGKRVTQVDPPPAGITNSDHYDVKINFELSTD